MIRLAGDAHERKIYARCWSLVVLSPSLAWGSGGTECGSLEVLAAASAAGTNEPANSDACTTLRLGILINCMGLTTGLERSLST